MEWRHDVTMTFFDVDCCIYGGIDVSAIFRVAAYKPSIMSYLFGSFFVGKSSRIDANVIRSVFSNTAANIAANPWN